MLKVSEKKVRNKFFRLDADQGLVTWESEKAGIIHIENIKEIRSGEHARYYREQFKVSPERESRWLTIVYTSDNKYKYLHVIAYSHSTAVLWERTLLSLRSIRQNVMSGQVSAARMWERHYWRGADMSQDERLELEEMERLCRRLNISLRKGELLERFKSADKGVKGYLDFSDFQQFVKRLQARPEIKRLWNKMRGEGLFDLAVFERFMREEQKQSDMAQEEIERLFVKYVGSTVTPSASAASSPETRPRPASPVRSNTSPPDSRPASPLRRSTSPAVQTHRPRSRSRSRTRSFAKLVPNALSGKIPPSAFSPSERRHQGEDEQEYSIVAGLAPSTALATPPHWTLDDFSAFLLSADNAAFGDRAHDMNRPLSEYFISSSHNTYLVGHQLVGESTIEGYIRALGAGCRSVEVDIWDGDTEPVITHGRTLTGSVPLRHVCQAIAKYAFVASPYPVIISAEMHAGIEQQTQVAAIFREAFGDMLVTCPVEGSTWTGPGDVEELEALPSPERLKNRVLVKFKNALMTEVEIEVDGEDEMTEETGTSDTGSVKELGRGMSIAKRMRRSFRATKRPDMSELLAVNVPPSPYPDTLAPPPMITPPATLPIPLGSPPTSPPRKKQRAYSNRSEHHEKPKLKMSRSLADLLIYTVGVKFRGLNKKERYPVEQMFSLSEKTANKVAKENAMGLVKHCRTNLVRLYPNGTRVASTNYDPTRYWATGVQLVALNWQTIDLGNMMNQAMFLRNNKAGYLLKPEALRLKDCKEQLLRRTEWFLDITVISAQQVPRRRDEVGREIIKDEIMDPLVEVSLHVPDWPTAPVCVDPNSPGNKNANANGKKVESSGKRADSSGKKTDSSGKKSETKSAERRTYRTTAVKNNGFNPVWEESVSIPFTCVGDMWDLVFVKFAVRDDDDDDDPLALYCASLGSLRQ
ncbi:Phospholipase C, partial [Ceratobasidium sp. 395]